MSIHSEPVSKAFVLGNPFRRLFSGFWCLKREYNNYRKKRLISQRLTEEGRCNYENHDNEDHDAAAEDDCSHENHVGEKAPDDP